MDKKTKLKNISNSGNSNTNIKNRNLNDQPTANCKTPKYNETSFIKSDSSPSTTTNNNNNYKNINSQIESTQAFSNKLDNLASYDVHNLNNLDTLNSINSNNSNKINNRQKHSLPQSQNPNAALINGDEAKDMAKRFSSNKINKYKEIKNNPKSSGDFENVKTNAKNNDASANAADYDASYENDTNLESKKSKSIKLMYNGKRANMAESNSFQTRKRAANCSNINTSNQNDLSEREFSEIANNDEDREENGQDNDDDDDQDDDNAEDDDDDEYNLENKNNHNLKKNQLFPGYVPVAFKYLRQDAQPRYFCLKLITSPWFERISMLIILINCITLGMYQPCNDNPCSTTRCIILQYLDHLIFIFFAIEMFIKLIAMGFIGKDTYMADTWNILDMFIVMAGTIEYLVASENLSLSAIRTIRVLRPLRAINRVPSMRILVMLLLDTLPMLGNVLLLCFFVFFIFGIVGVQLWKGVLRNRCFFDYNQTLMHGLVHESFQNTYYKPEHTDSFICTEAGGMSTCADIPPYLNNSKICNSTIERAKFYNYAANQSCINWNFYYSKCRPSDKNPFKGAISFDNIGFAWVAIFQIISLESWVTIMYYIQDAHSFWNWIYFVFLIVIGSFFMINLCLVVIATQFSETKKRETERMIAERRRFSRSTSTLLSDSGNEPGSCWEELIKYVLHLMRKSKRRIVKEYNQYKNKRKKRLLEKTLKLNKKTSNSDNQVLLVNREHLKADEENCRCVCHYAINNDDYNTDNTNKVALPKNLNAKYPHFHFNFASMSNNSYNNNNDNNNSNNNYFNKPTSANLNNYSANTTNNSSYNNNNTYNNNIYDSCTNNSDQQMGGDQISSSSFKLDLIKTLEKTLESENDLPSLQTNLSVPKASLDCYQMTDMLSNEVNQSPSQCQSQCQSPNEHIDTVAIYEPAENEHDVMFGDNNFEFENCTFCKRMKSSKLACCNKNRRALNLNDSAIFSSSIGSSFSNKKIDTSKNTSNANANNNKNMILNINADNENYYYCYSTVKGNKNAGPNFNDDKDSDVNEEEWDANENTELNKASRLLKKKKHASRKAAQQQICCYCCCFCCAEKLSDSRFCKLVNSCQDKLKYFVDSKFFQRTILFAILINTLSMGIEHHQQPPTLTLILEYSNIFFSGVFLLEMVLKLLAYGIFDYIKNAFNLFDGLIVGISVYEVFKQFISLRFSGGSVSTGPSGVSVLRTFRLLRILKLVRFMPALRRQLLVMLKTIDNVATFFSLLILFIFIFSILGMNLFGCKFCSLDADGNRMCERKNFDSLLWAIITVFQVLTQEDWNEVLYNSMEKTTSWAALYYIALMTFGNYVLFNLLVAILVEGFSTEDEPKKAIEERIIEDAMHAIAEEEAQSRENAQVYVHKEGSRKSRKSSKVSASGLSDPERQMLKEADSSSQHQKPNNQLAAANSNRLALAENIAKSPKSDSSSRPFSLDSSTNANERTKNKMNRKFMQLPIITHTCPTPVHTPTTSSRNSPLFANYRLLFDSKYVNSRIVFKYPPRKFSLDSANARIKPNGFTLNKHLTRSTFTKIYDKHQLNLLRHSLNQDRLNKIRNASIPADFSFDASSFRAFKLTLPKITINDANNKLDSSLLYENRYIASNSPPPPLSSLVTSHLFNGQAKASKASSTSSEIANIFEAKTRVRIRDDVLAVMEKSSSSSQSSLSLSSLYSSPAKLIKSSKLDRNRKISKSFNETCNSLSIPKPIYKHTRSRSEKVRNTHKTASTTHRYNYGRANLNNGNNTSHSYNTNTNKLQQVSTSHNAPIFNAIESDHDDYDLANQQAMASSAGGDHEQDETENLINDDVSCQTITNQSSHDKKICIQKSPPYNVDIIVSSSNNASPRRGSKRSSKKGKKAKSSNNNNNASLNSTDNDEMIDFNCCAKFPKPKGCFKSREQYSLYVLSKDNKFRLFCMYIAQMKWFDYTILLFISLNCITLAMERPNIPPTSLERKFLTNSNYIFTLIFTIEMLIKVLANGFFIGEEAYLKSGWNVMDCFLVFISLIDVIVTLSARSSPKIFGILRVFRLLRTLRPLRMISRAPGLKLVVQTLLSSLRPIGNIVLICCTFFIIFGILGVQLFKGKLYRCVGENLKEVKSRDDCLSHEGNQWINSQYNFDNLGQALMALFVLSSKDGWVQIMYTGIDAVGVDKQPIVNHNEWMLLYFISFLLLVGFFVLNMFVGVVIENFHKCREEQEREEKARRAAKRAKKFEEKRRRMKEIPYFANYSKTRRLLHDICNSKYFDLIIAGVIGLNVVSMSLEFYMMPKVLDEVLDIFNYIFTFIFLMEAIMRLVALGVMRYFKERWNQLDIIIVILSIAGIVFDKLNTKSAIPINPTIIRVMRVLRIARVLKLLKMAKGIRSLLDTVIQALPQVGNLGLLFFLLFFIFAILGVELFGRLNCESITSACDGLSKHAHFHNFGMAFLTLFRIATGDNWNGIMKDTLRENILCTDEHGNTSSMCLASILAPIYFVIFVLMAQFVLVNVVVAVLMKHLDESNKMMADDAEMDEEIEKQLEAEARNNIYNDTTLKMENEFENDSIRPYAKQSSLPPNFTFDLLSEVTAKTHSNQTPIHSIKSQQTDLNNNELVNVASSHKTYNREGTGDHSAAASGSRANKYIKYKSILKHNDCKSLISDADSSSAQLVSDRLENVIEPFSTISNQQQQVESSSPNLSINNENDSVSAIIKLKETLNSTSSAANNNNANNSFSSKTNKTTHSKFDDDSNSSSNNVYFVKSHFSPQSSIKIKVIDETDTDN